MSHTGTLAPGCLQAVQISARNSIPAEVNWMFSSYLDATETSTLTSLSTLPNCQWQGWGALDWWVVTTLSSARLLCLVPSWTRWHQNPNRSKRVAPTAASHVPCMSRGRSKPSHTCALQRVPQMSGRVVLVVTRPKETWTPERGDRCKRCFSVEGMNPLV